MDTPRDLVDQTRSIRLVMLGPAPETHSGAAATIENCRALGLFKRWPVDYIATHGGGGPRADLALAARAVQRFGELIGRHRRLVVHVHAAPGWGFWRDAAFALLALATHCPLVLQLHGGGFPRFYDEAAGPARPTLRFLLERAACVLVPSEAMRKWVRALARDAHPVVAPSPVATTGVAREPEAQGMVLFLGELDARLGLHDLLEAVAALHREDPERYRDLRVVCAGEGRRTDAARLAERLGIGEAVKFTGWVGPSGKRALLENATLLALPAYEAGLPLSVLEAMGAGVPVVVSNVGALPEAVADGVNGFVVAPGDQSALRRALAALLADPALAARIGAAARESARLRHSPERALGVLEDVYAAVGLSALQGSVARAEMKEAA